jgi:hypothetical protein
LNPNDLATLKSLLSLVTNSNLAESFEMFSSKLNTKFMRPAEKTRLVERSKILFGLIDIMPSVEDFLGERVWMQASLVLSLKNILNKSLFTFIVDQNRKLQMEFVHDLEENANVYAQNQMKLAYDAEQVMLIQKTLVNFEAHLTTNHAKLSLEAFVMSLNVEVVHEEVRDKFQNSFK